MTMEDGGPWYGLLCLADDSVRRYFEGEVEGGEVLVRVIGRIGELGDAEIVGVGLGALVDARIEIDEVPAGRAGRLHEHLDIALAVEGAGVARIGVVVDHVDDVGGLGPAPAFEMQREFGADRSPRDVDGKRGRLDELRPDLLGAAGVDPEPMRAAEIIGRLEAELDLARSIRLRLGEGVREFLPAPAGHPVADDLRPIELVSLAGR